MRIVNFVERAFSVPHLIARPALFAACWHLIFVACVTVIKSGTNALFLARADPRQLPLLYVAVAVTVALSTAVLARLLTRLPASLVLTVGVVASAVAVGVSTLAAAYHVPGAAAVAYVVGEAAATSGSVLFWARLSDAFHTRDQKKVVGLVGAGGMLGAAIGGLGIRLVAQHVGVVGPMLAAAVLWVVTLPMLRALRARAGGRDDGRPASLVPAVRYLLTRGYPIAVAGLVVLLAALGAGTDFVFRTAAAHTRTEAEMAGLFGLLNTAVGIVVVLFQVTLTSKLLARVGVFVFIAIVPMLLVGTSVVSLLLGPDSPHAFALVLLMKGIEMAGAYSLHQTGVALLYNPMPGELRSQVRTLVDGAVKKIGAALCGLLLGALAALRPDLVGAWLVGATGFGLLVLLPPLRTRYLHALSEKLGNTSARMRPGAIDTSDRVTQDVLTGALLSPDPQSVLSALDALGPQYKLSSVQMSTLVEHSDERVRIQALTHAPLVADDALVQRLVLIARVSGPRRPRAEAVRALARLKRVDIADLLVTFLAEDEPGVVAAAIEGVMSSVHAARAQTRLDALLVDLPSRTPAWRREVARLLGRLDEPRYDQALAQLIDDDDVTVRALAIDAAGREHHAAHVPLLIQQLGDRAVRSRAATALVNYGDAAVDMLSLALDDRASPLAPRVMIPRVLARIQTPAAARALIFSNPKDDAYLQQRIAGALVQMVEVEPGLLIDRKRVDEAIGRRLVAYAAYDDAHADLEPDPSVHLRLLKRAVAERRQQNLKIALDLLGIHRGLSRMQSVYTGLVATDAAARHDALELLDATLQGDALRTDFLSLLERNTTARTLNDCEQRSAGLCASKDPIIRAIAQRSVVLLNRGVSSAPRAVGLSANELEGDDMDKALVERLFVLEHVDLFEGLSADDLAAIAQIAREFTVDANHVLYHEGDTSTQMYIIVEGEVLLTRANRHVMTLRSGESAGQVSFLDRGPRPVTARIGSQRKASLLVIERDVFMDLLTDRPSLMHAFFGVLAQRLRALLEREDPSRRRVATAV